MKLHAGSSLTLWPIALALALVACQKHDRAEDEAKAKPQAQAIKPQEEEGEGLSLKPDEIEKLGIVSAELKSSKHSAEVTGYAVVIAHETIAQPVAELNTALAMEHQSRAALERTHRLAGTPGAMPADAEETAERQSAVDKAALDLARRRLSSLFGQHAPWSDQDQSADLTALASGASKLVRASFALGELGDSHPTMLELAHLHTAPGAKHFESRRPWNAPADVSVPGRSFFAILKGTDVGEGERLLAWAPVGEARDGLIIPASAALISNGRYWCYVEAKPGTFVRTEFDPTTPTGEGYFVSEGLKAGDKVVVAAAAQLLARELNPSTEAE